MNRAAVIAAFLLAACGGNGAGTGAGTETQTQTQTQTRTGAGTGAGAGAAQPKAGYTVGDGFCSGRVYPRGGKHISWTSHASPDAPTTVIAALTKKHGAPSATKHTDQATWRWPKDKPTRALSVEPAGYEGPWVRNGCKLPAKTKSVITSSNFGG